MIAAVLVSAIIRYAVSGSVFHESSFTGFTDLAFVPIVAVAHGHALSIRARAMVTAGFNGTPVFNTLTRLIRLKSSFTGFTCLSGISSVTCTGKRILRIFAGAMTTAVLIRAEVFRARLALAHVSFRATFTGSSRVPIFARTGEVGGATGAGAVVTAILTRAKVLATISLIVGDEASHASIAGLAAISIIAAATEARLAIGTGAMTAAILVSAIVRA